MRGNYRVSRRNYRVTARNRRVTPSNYSPTRWIRRGPRPRPSETRSLRRTMGRDLSDLRSNLRSTRCHRATSQRLVANTRSVLRLSRRLTQRAIATTREVATPSRSRGSTDANEVCRNAVAIPDSRRRIAARGAVVRDASRLYRSLRRRTGKRESFVE